VEQIDLLKPGSSTTYKLPPDFKMPDTWDLCPEIVIKTGVTVEIIGQGNDLAIPFTRVSRFFSVQGGTLVLSGGELRHETCETPCNLQ
jgi:hypothetical protein